MAEAVGAESEARQRTVCRRITAANEWATSPRDSIAPSASAVSAMSPGEWSCRPLGVSLQSLFLSASSFPIFHGPLLLRTRAEEGEGSAEGGMDGREVGRARAERTRTARGRGQVDEEGDARPTRGRAGASQLARGAPTRPPARWPLPLRARAYFVRASGASSATRWAPSRASDASALPHAIVRSAADGGAGPAGESRGRARGCGSWPGAPNVVAVGWRRSRARPHALIEAPRVSIRPRRRRPWSRVSQPKEGPRHRGV
jgi:hypothetical protein